MYPSDNLPSLNVTFEGLTGFSYRNYTTKPQLYYQGMSIKVLNLPIPLHFCQSNADQNNAHFINPLNEFCVTSLTEAVPDGFDELELPVIS